MSVGVAHVLGPALLFAAAASVGVLPGDNPGWKSAEVEINACFEAMDRDPALAVVNAKYARRDPTPEQLANQGVATDQEADQFRARVAKTRPCRDMRLDAVKRFYPLLEPSYRILYYQADQLFEYLSGKWITYGEANRLSRISQLKATGRQRDFFEARDAKSQLDMSKDWNEQLQRAHADPPPTHAAATCEWSDLGLACR